MVNLSGLEINFAALPATRLCLHSELKIHLRTYICQAHIWHNSVQRHFPPNTDGHRASYTALSRHWTWDSYEMHSFLPSRPEKCTHVAWQLRLHAICANHWAGYGDLRLFDCGKVSTSQCSCHYNWTSFFAACCHLCLLIWTHGNYCMATHPGTHVVLLQMWTSHYLPGAWMNYYKTLTLLLDMLYPLWFRYNYNLG